LFFDFSLTWLRLHLTIGKILELCKDCFLTWFDMKVVDLILNKLAHQLDQGAFDPIETDKIELKDLSSGENWDELYKSVCAFLNTEGGIVIVGVREKDRRYKVTGYRNEQSTEDKIKNLPNTFKTTDGVAIDLKDYFPPPSIIDFRDRQLLVLFVEKLPEHLKYVQYKETAYRRRLTGDEKIKPNEVIAQNEYKAELAYAQELAPVPNATLEHLDLDKVNEYIQLLNGDVKVETLKPDLSAARSFLQRKGFLAGDAPTVLGILVIGRHPFDLLGGRCEVDAYVDVPTGISSQLVTQGKQTIKANTLDLMEAARAFVNRNINVGISPVRGGVAEPEYPDKLIREVINNALAHRSYSAEANEVVHLIIRPGQSIEVRNSGQFRQEQQLRFDAPPTRRIIPIARANNPRLADILKTYNRWEGRGIGMSTLTNYCLDNVMDVPYFIIRHFSISLFVVKGKVLDEPSEAWLRSFGAHIRRKLKREPMEKEKILLSYFYKSEKLNAAEKYTILLTADNNHFAVIGELANCGLIAKHPNGQELYPVYLVERLLVRNDFSEELTALFGADFALLPDFYRSVLHLIFQLEHYGEMGNLSARSLSPMLYLREHKDFADARAYDNFKRKMRLVISELAKNKFIYQPDAKLRNYRLNPNYTPKPATLPFRA
jgi:ATP-dependent DNA helicase RecG